jgi:DNA-directed RNA polymerase specialized sigma24 family protein
MIEDTELLRRYVETRSEAAFAELVQRRIGLVYSVALRATRNVHRAEDVTQTVFADLARKAESLADRPVLAGWLYRSARFAALSAVRAEQNRAAREQEAQIMQEIRGDGSAPEWEKVRPVLDQIMS